MVQFSKEITILRGKRGVLAPLSPATRKRALALLAHGEPDPMAAVVAASRAVGEEMDELTHGIHPSAWGDIGPLPELRALWRILAALDPALVTELRDAVARPVVRGGPVPAHAAICNRCGYLWIDRDRIKAPSLARCGCFWCGETLRPLKVTAPKVRQLALAGVA